MNKAKIGERYIGYSTIVEVLAPKGSWNVSSTEKYKNSHIEYGDNYTYSICLKGGGYFSLRNKYATTIECSGNYWRLLKNQDLPEGNII